MGLLVLGAHLAGVLAWWVAGHDASLAPKGGALAPLTVWLPPLRMSVVESLKRTLPPEWHHTQRPRLGSDADHESANESEVQAPAEPSAESAATQAATPSNSALNLSLPSKALTSLAPPSAAALSPFHGRLPATVEQIIANAAAESGPWTEEHIDNDHIRLRRGNTCVLMERPEAAALDPFSDAARRMPWRASVSRC